MTRAQPLTSRRLRGFEALGLHFAFCLQQISASGSGVCVECVHWI